MLPQLHCLREKLGMHDAMVETVRGVGYRAVAPT